MNDIEHHIGDYLIMGSVFDQNSKTLYSIIDITEDNKIVVQECVKDSESNGAIYILKWNKDLGKWTWRHDIYEDHQLVAEFLN